MQAVPAFFSMITQGVLDAPTFSIYLNPDPLQEPSGQIEFGGYDTARFVGTLNWAPVVDKSCGFFAHFTAPASLQSVGMLLCASVLSLHGALAYMWPTTIQSSSRSSMSTGFP